MTQPLAEHIEELAQQIRADLTKVRRDLSAIAANPTPPELPATVTDLRVYRERRRSGVSR